MRVEVDHAQEFGFPLWGHGRRPPWRCAGRQGREPPLEKAFEHALDGIAAAQDNGRHLGDRAPLMGQKNEVGAEAKLGFGRRIVQLSEFEHLGVGQRR